MSPGYLRWQQRAGASKSDVEEFSCVADAKV